MKTGSEVFIDTNILVYSTLEDFDREKYLECRQALNQFQENDFSLNISTQVLREFYGVVTGKKYLKTPLEPDAAKNQLIYFMSVFNVIEISHEVILKLIKLIDKYKIIGQKIHDATIAATMLNSNIDTLLSYNRRDFVVFDEIKIVEPTEVLNFIHF